MKRFPRKITSLIAINNPHSSSANLASHTLKVYARNVLSYSQIWHSNLQPKCINPLQVVGMYNRAKYGRR